MIVLYFHDQNINKIRKRSAPFFFFLFLFILFVLTRCKFLSNRSRLNQTDEHVSFQTTGSESIKTEVFL